MSMDYWEYQQEEAMSEYYEELYLSEFKERAIDEFTAERLCSYYVDNSKLLDDSFRAFDEAKKVAALSPTSGLIMAAISIELAIKIGLLKPIVFGFVHSEAVAESISNTVIKQTGIDRFKALLVELLKNISQIDIVTYKRTGQQNMSLWDERGKVQTLRNSISHRGSLTSAQDCQLAIDIADAVLNELLPDVLASLGLRIQNKIIVE
ncbi:hypothetical protein L2737_06260 [Shewanella electrodiphila]|uniref:RiboL-PSP-HEPN domain-containing protein n=1 Tax=Shewanella electrodiphila TaxID=934143 RepID=A0ABT0KM56_9GAMM|nr:hypothetical protein [Shewanella electrodiphila]MCL1044931.1 hypothetical protein [Shewanella electrodiphila]